MMIETNPAVKDPSRSRFDVAWLRRARKNAPIPAWISPWNNPNTNKNPAASPVPVLFPVVGSISEPERWTAA